MERIDWNKVIDRITVTMLGIALLMLVVCTVVLLFFDSFAGTGTWFNLTQGNLTVSALISLSTTGLQTALAFIALLARVRGYGKIGNAFLVAAVMVMAVDVFFDSLTADILRYGMFVAVSNLTGIEKTTQILARVLIGGMSSIGEFLAVAIIVGMPELKQFIRGLFPAMSAPRQSYTPAQTQRTYPASIPTRRQPSDIHDAQMEEFFTGSGKG